ncbi:MAG: hypothetical protein AAF125_05670 [Chloroflexota bacterium]
MRTPEQIIGEDACIQLLFEGYKIVPDGDALTVGDHVKDRQSGIWQGVIQSMRPMRGVFSPALAITDTGRGKREWNVSRLRKCEKPDFVDWEVPTMEHSDG